MNKVVLLRPGALGDVLAARETVAFLKAARPGAEVALTAPGAKGRFLARPGWADSFFDWERRETAWLFADNSEEPPEALATFFAGADLVLAYLDTGRNGGDDGFRDRLAWLAPKANIVVSPSRPPEGSEIAISTWLARAVLPFVEKFAPRETASALAAFAASRKISLPPAKEIFKGEEQTGRYVVIHPGSGSRKKNWPLENFIQVGARLQRAKAPGGAPFFKRMVVVSGEADGDLGERLHRSLPGSRHLHGLELESLASLIAGAFLYVGNDSGVSHLAGSVVGPAGESPLLAVVFGPSDSRVWAPPGALVLEAGPDLDKLDPIGVCGQIGKSLGFSC